MSGSDICCTCDAVGKSFKVGDGMFNALTDISLTINNGDFCGLVGPSVSGKTTLLNLIGLLGKPTTGTLTIFNQISSDADDTWLAHQRAKNIGFIFQMYYLFPHYSVFENVEYPLLVLNMDPDTRRQKVEHALDIVGLSSKAKNMPNEISGGESQRVAIARAIVKSPPLVIADEPTANLDAKNSLTILDIMQEINANSGTTFIFSTHDPKVMDRLKRTIVLSDGRIVSG